MYSPVFLPGIFWPSLCPSCFLFFACPGYAYLLEHDPTPRTILWLVLSTTNSSFYSDTFLLWLSSVNSSTLTSRREAIFLRLRVQKFIRFTRLSLMVAYIWYTSKHWPLYLCRNASKQGNKKRESLKVDVLPRPMPWHIYLECLRETNHSLPFLHFRIWLITLKQPFIIDFTQDISLYNCCISISIFWYLQLARKLFFARI